jgi:ech hydrogenase subunit F
MQLLQNLIRNAFSRPVTKRYPFEAYVPEPGTRGHLEMDPDRCTYCGVCQKRCPTGAITVTRKPDKSWTLRVHQCILCSYCVEVCPKDCLVMAERHAAPAA